MSWSPSRRRLPALPALALALLALAGCGDFPQPFRGRPGGQAAMLARPPAIRIAVPPPEGALLTDAAAAGFAEAIAEALQAAEIPAAATAPLPLDWRLTVEAEREGGSVRPRFALLDADGTALGTVATPPVPVRDWAEGDAAPLRRVAAQAAPSIATLVARTEAARKTTDPAALAAGIGPPRLRLTPVRGAPGDGNAALAARMRDFLTGQGLLVQEEGEGAAFAVQGAVNVVPATVPGQQRVEILWTVTRRDGQELGRVLQMNEVPTGSLNRLWGDVAYVVAEEAAGGVRDVIRNAGGLPAAAPPSATPAATPPTAGAAGEAAGAPPPPPSSRPR